MAQFPAQSLLTKARISRPWTGNSWNEKGPGAPRDYTWTSSTFFPCVWPDMVCRHASGAAVGGSVCVTTVRIVPASSSWAGQGRGVGAFPPSSLRPPLHPLRRLVHHLLDAFIAQPRAIPRLIEQHRD